MVFDMDIRELQGIIDADGSGSYKTVAFPDLPEPYCWRGYHVQQFIRYAVSRGFTVTPVELSPAVAPPLLHQRGYQAVPIYQGPHSWSLFIEIIRASRGVLTGNLALPGEIIRGHAVAYEHGHVYDPRGRHFDYSPKECEANDLYANCAWRVDRRK
jgi:hypothetical protein